jgi:two-component system NtrC family sensor kinase
MQTGDLAPSALARFRAVIAAPVTMLFLASILLPLVVFSLGAWQAQDQLYRDAEKKVSGQAAALYEHAQKVLQTQKLVLQQATQLTRGMDWAEIGRSAALWQSLSTLTKDIRQIEALFLVAPDGRLVLTTRGFPSPPVNLADRDYFIAQREHDVGAYLSGSYLGRIGDRPNFNISMRRMAPRGFDGVLGASVSTTYFLEFYATVTIPDDGTHIAFLRDDGQVLVSYPEGPVGTQKWAGGFLHEVQQSRGGVLYAKIEGIPRLIGYRKLNDFPAYISFGVDERIIRTAWYRALVPWAFLSAFASFLMAVAAVVTMRWMRREAEAVSKAERSQAALLVETERRSYAEAALLHSRKLEALGQLTGGVAHDFNNLLQVANLNIEIISRLASDEQTQQAVERSQHAFEHGAALVQRLLAFARHRPLEVELFDLNERIRHCREILVQLVPGVYVEFALAEDLWLLKSDAVQLELAVINLVVNAGHAMDNEGKVVIATGNRRIAGEAGLTGDFVALSVCDDGPGIAPDLLETVWQPFFTTKAEGKGSGLGLAMVYRFAREAGGTATIDSQLGVGTTVTIYVPRATRVKLMNANSDGRRPVIPTQAGH